MEKRPFGKTGVELPILSLGCQRPVDEEGCSQDQAVAILEQALEVQGLGTQGLDRTERTIRIDTHRLPVMVSHTEKGDVDAA